MQSSQSIRVAVVTGGHSFNVVEFHDLFGQLSGIRAYIQHMDDFFDEVLAQPSATLAGH